MQYILLRKNEPILTFKYLKSGQLQIVETYDNTLLPLNIQEISNVYLKDWLSKRCISKSRRNLSKLYDVTGCNSVLELSFYNHSTNLVDFYWTKKEEESITWDDVDFRRNGYSESVGNMLLKKDSSIYVEESPDINTNGITEKAWKRINGGDYLFKLGRAPFFQEPYNEIACSKVAQCFPVLNAVSYFLGQVEEKPASVCPNFLKENQEFVPAAHLVPKKHPQDAIYLRLAYICKELGMHNVKEFIDNMIAFDYVINNTDRHLGNFGFLRDGESGVYLGPAPIFDNGNSLWFDEPTEMNFNVENFAKPFCDYQEQQLRLAKHLDNVDFLMLRTIPEIIRESLLNVCDTQRTDKIAFSVQKRIEDLYVYREKLATREKNQHDHSYEEVK